MENPSSEHSGSALGSGFGTSETLRRASDDARTAVRTTIDARGASIERPMTASDVIITCRDDVETVRRPSPACVRPPASAPDDARTRRASARESSIERFRPSNARKSSSEPPEGVSRPNPPKNPRQNRNK